MDIYAENERINLKSSENQIENYYKKRTKEKKQLRNKNDIINKYCIIIISILFTISFFIIIFKLILEKERNYFENEISNLEQEKDSLKQINIQLQKENEKSKQEKIMLLNKSKKNVSGNTTKKYKIVAISYGNDRYSKQLEFNGKSALEIAKVDEFYGYTPNHIDPEFREKNQYILEKSRGNGYWLWKPYFLYRTLTEKLNYGDYLIYSDAAIMYVDSALKLVNFLNEKNVEMYTHRLPHLERMYTKRDAFILMGVDSPFYAETGQFNAAFQIYRKSTFTEFFLKEYLYYAQDRRIITDDSNEMGEGNYPGFRDHRHDQSILSLLIKKYGQVNANKTNADLEKIKNFEEVMPTIFCHYRQRGVSDYEGLKNMCKDVRGNF